MDNSKQFSVQSGDQLNQENSFEVIFNRIKLNNPLNFSVSAPGKLILFGEHSVVYGKSAIAASINKRTKLSFWENNIDNSFYIYMRPLNFCYSNSFNDLIEFINCDIPGNDMKPLSERIADPNDINHEEFFEFLKKNFDKILCCQDPLITDKQRLSSLFVFLYLFHGIFYKETLVSLSSFVIDITTELTLGAGTGSSASFCVSIAAALLYLKNVKLHGLSSSKEITFSEQGLKLISKWAFNGEKIMHGKPSGVDNTVATFGSFIEVVNEKVPGSTEMLKKFLNLNDPPKICVILIDTGVLRNTALLVQNVSKLRGNNPEIVLHILNAMHEVSEKAAKIIKTMGIAQAGGLDSPEFSHLEDLVDVNQGLLYSLGTSHKRLQEICLICSEYGLHAKLTGAGGGGYAFTLIPPRFDKSKLLLCINELKSKNFKVSNIELGTEGVRLE